MDYAYEEEKKLLADIKRGLAEKEFQLYIQFYVNAKTKRIVGGEALARWKHPQRGLLFPGSFIPLMEKADLISQLDYDLLRQACKFLEQIHQIRIDNFFISCNFSSKTLSKVDFADKCQEILESYEFTRKHLVFQITEKALDKNPTIVENNIQKIKSIGARIALDDFGEGITFLVDIQKCPLDILELDKRLIDLLDTDAGNLVIDVIVETGHTLGITILAEGAESLRQVQLLQEMGCDIIQGFYFYHPLPYREAINRLLAQTLGAG